MPAPARRLALVLLLALPWLWPFTSGPVAATQPYLVSAAVAAALLALWPARPSAGWAAAGWLAAALASGVIALLQYFDLETALYPWVNIAQPGQAFGNLRQPNQLATLLAIGLLSLRWCVQAGRLNAGPAAGIAALLVAALAATASRVGLVELAAGAALRLEPGTHELLLLDGRLVADGQPVALHDYLIGQGAVQAREPSRFYLRHHAPQDPFQCAEGWQRVRPGESAWQPLREGVDICPLHQQSGAVSMLARFAAGGRVPAHAHGIDEQCLMVEGELFLGDLLLREGGFQHAPPGSAHGELMADRPCLLFFHGAIDPVAVDPAWRAEQGFAPM